MKIRSSFLLLAALTSTFTMAADTGTHSGTKLPPIVGHRGESYIAPENTMASFNLGWQGKGDGCENDIQLTRDGKVIVCHDPDTFRTTGGKKGDPASGTRLVIKDATADELRKLDVGSWKDPKYKGEKLPFLDECIASIPEGKVFFVEIKSGTDVVPAAAKIIKASGKKPEQVVLISFHDDALAQSKKLLPDHKHYLLASSKPRKGADGKDEMGWQFNHGGKPKWVPTDQIIEVAKAAHADGVNLQNKPPLDKAFIDKCHAAGMPCLVWTEDDAAAAKKYVEWGIDGITTNRPTWLKEQLQAGDARASR